MALHHRKNYNEESSKLAISSGVSLQISSTFPKLVSDILKRAALTNRGIIYTQTDGSEQYQSYQDLLLDAQKVLAGLRQCGLKPQDKVILQLEQGQDFLPAFWGCVLGGFVPVPLSISLNYQGLSSTVRKLYHAWELLEHPIILTNQRLAPDLNSLSELLEFSGFDLKIIEDLRKNEGDTHWHTSHPDDLLILLLTSGTTGKPKAVKQSHHSVLCRSLAAIQMNHFSEQEITLNWMPLDHVGGLVMFHIRDVYVACQQIHVSTSFILGRPLRWLDLLDHYRVTVTWAPNFAYGLINNQLDSTSQGTWDLSALRFILNAGEPIVAATARKFLMLLSPYGLPETAMHPAWGMSETSSAVTYSQEFSLRSTSNSDSFVEVGCPIPEFSVCIVNEDNQLVSEGTIGSLQVKGLSVTSGYYCNPDANQEAFTQDGWFKTGDLGFLREGRLTITGRNKDIIIINGVNYHSHELEAIIEDIPGIAVSYTAACAVNKENDQSEQLAIFFSPLQFEDDFVNSLIQHIRENLIKIIGLSPNYLIPVDQQRIPKTNIGKIQRQKLRQDFEAGEFDDLLYHCRHRLYEDSAEYVFPKTEVEQVVASVWQYALGTDVVGRQDNFFELGGHSLALLQVQSQLQEYFNCELPIADLFRYSTIETLAQYLTKEKPEDDASQRGERRARTRQQKHGKTIRNCRNWDGGTISRCRQSRKVLAKSPKWSRIHYFL